MRGWWPSGRSSKPHHQLLDQHVPFESEWGKRPGCLVHDCTAGNKGLARGWFGGVTVTVEQICQLMRCDWEHAVNCILWGATRLGGGGGEMRDGIAVQMCV